MSSPGKSADKEKERLSQTMRIDLIPDVPSKPVPGKKKYVVSVPPDRAVAARVRAGDEGERGSDYEQLLQSLYDAVLLSDLSGKIVDANLRAEESLLYDRTELCQLTVFDVVSGTNETLLQTLLENLQNERYTLIQAYCLRKDGTYFPSEIAVNQLRLAETRLCFFFRDTTLRRQAEEMLRTEHNAIQNSGDGIAITNLDTQMEYVNPAVVHMWAYDSSEEMINGMEVGKLWAEQEKADEMMRAIMGEKQMWKGEIKARRKDGSEFETQVSAALNRNSDGEPVGAIFSFVDISDRKRAEQAEREAERRRVMLESLGAACHHLGQPATVLLANLGIMKKKLETVSDPMVRELLDGSIMAMETLGEILHKLNAVNEYKTTKYLETADGSASTRILEI